ncbi:hypothetical protein BU15DRAFT_73884 [Melanogaster broomeanus]|nr:hypothetical protein BU15DRAFT_73884 [Melanogaster broomeanus]
MSEAQRERQSLLPYENVEVWPIIHMIRGDVIHYIDTPLSFEALIAPDLTYTLIRPLEDKYNAIHRAGNKSVVFCFLLNRVYFVRDQNLTTIPLSSTRATFCELLAIRILRDNSHSMFDLVRTLTTSWPVWSGADPHAIEMAREEREDLEERVGNAIEMAIISKARRFIKSSPCQKVIDGIWVYGTCLNASIQYSKSSLCSGKCVYQAESSHSILSDRYKRTPIHFYDPHKAPLLDHYRLKVPAIRAVLEYINYLILFVLFIVAIEMNERRIINTPEMLFMVYALGFTLEKLAAMQERGITVYFKGTWNGFDLAFVTAYFIYAGFRIYGIVYHQHWAQDIGIDFLAVIACLLFPRLAFVTLKNNLMVLSLRAMMMQFVALMLIAAFCFCGFFYALWTLSRKGAGYSASTIGWWMLDLWFGLDASGFDRAGEFDVVFGPMLMIMYACMSNTLLLTVLVSILSNTFARINEDAAAEAYVQESSINDRRADSLFSYQPPINVVALCILLPSSYVLSPRWFHKVNVFLIRATNFPILLMIAWYERLAKRNSTVGFYDTIASVLEKVTDALPRTVKRMSLLEGLAGSGADIDVIFDIEEEMGNALDTEDYGEHPPTQASNGLQRRVSRKSDRPSRSSLYSAQPPSPKEQEPPSLPAPQSSGAPEPPQVRPPSPSRTPSHIRQISAPIPLHRRVNSSISRPDVIPSPLAQVFQPLIMDDEIPEEAIVDGNGGGGGILSPPVISYGPATRRRLTSMQSMFRRQTDLSAPTPIVRRRPFPVIDTRQETLAGSLSSSPEQQPGMAFETAEQVEEDSEQNGGMTEWLRRMGQMEERQKRIEDLLIQLNSKVQSAKK